MEVIKEKAERLRSGQATINDIGHELNLTTKQIDFARYYTTEEFFGNGMVAYAKAYGLNANDKNQRNRAAVGASTSLRHSTILMLIDIILDSEGFNDQFVDKQLLMVIQQSADLKSKMLAIKEYNALKSRIKTNIEINVKPEFDYTMLSNEELAVLVALSEKARVGGPANPNTSFLRLNKEV